MIQITPQMRIVAAVEPADFRCGIDGLARRCKDVLRHDPFRGWVFVFRNRSATALKVLVYDGQGFWLCHKRLSSGRRSAAGRGNARRKALRCSEGGGGRLRHHCRLGGEQEHHDRSFAQAAFRFADGEDQNGAWRRSGFTVAVGAGCDRFHVGTGVRFHVGCGDRGEITGEAPSCRIAVNDCARRWRNARKTT